jgi:hypothetical protein
MILRLHQHDGISRHRQSGSSVVEIRNTSVQRMTHSDKRGALAPSSLTGRRRLCAPTNLAGIATAIPWIPQRNVVMNYGRSAFRTSLV